MTCSRQFSGMERDAKRSLHRIQGLGNIWFAGNNTPIDPEEGVLISGMEVASQLSHFRNPFPRLSSAWAMYNYFRELMFPAPGNSKLVDRLGR